MYGASFSLKYAREMQVNAKDCLAAALQDLGVRRLRLMSYWNEHEKVRGAYDFSELDWQIDLAEQYGAEVTLCLGLRQPRWPESHWPDWARELPEAEWQKALSDFITAVVERYKDRACIVSYQLENEALLKTFGLDGNFDRKRLRNEFKLVKKLVGTRPVIMTTSDAWGVPWRAPLPDIVGFSIYRYLYDAKKGRYIKSTRKARFYHLRALLIRALRRRRTFIHELQTEPWGPKATIELDVQEQYKSMNLAHIKEAVQYARDTGLLSADLWGLEWWYWLKTVHKEAEIWDYLKTVYKQDSV